MSPERQSSLAWMSGSDFFFSSLHLLVLWNFATAQPLFDLLARHPEFFVARQSAPLDIILFVVLVCLGFPTLLILLVWGTRWIHRRLSLGLLLFLLSMCAVALSLQALHEVQAVSATVLVLGAVLLGLITVISYYKFSLVRTFFTMLSPGLLLFPFSFLFFSPVRNASSAFSVAQSFILANAQEFLSLLFCPKHSGSTSIGWSYAAFTAG